MTGAPLVPGRVYGLRLWRVVAGADGERLVSPDHRTEWPVGGEPIAARCARHDHPAPAAGCGCGVYAWHPRPATARRVLQWRWFQPGIVEAWGGVEVHLDGFRAERARVHALVSLPARFPAQLRRLAAAYETGILELRTPAELVAHCEARALGLAEPTVAALLGADYDAARSAGLRRRRAEAAWLTGAALAAGAPLVAALPWP